MCSGVKLLHLYLSCSSFQLYNQSGDVSLVRSGVGGYRRGAPLVAGQLVQGEPYPTNTFSCWEGRDRQLIDLVSIASSWPAFTTYIMGCGVPAHSSTVAQWLAESCKCMQYVQWVHVFLCSVEHEMSHEVHIHRHSCWCWCCLLSDLLKVDALSALAHFTTHSHC